MKCFPKRRAAACVWVALGLVAALQLATLTVPTATVYVAVAANRIDAIVRVGARHHVGRFQSVSQTVRATGAEPARPAHGTVTFGYNYDCFFCYFFSSPPPAPSLVLVPSRTALFQCLSHEKVGNVTHCARRGLRFRTTADARIVRGHNGSCFLATCYISDPVPIVATESGPAGNIAGGTITETDARAGQRGLFVNATDTTGGSEAVAHMVLPQDITAATEKIQSNAIASDPSIASEAGAQSELVVGWRLTKFLYTDHEANTEAATVRVFGNVEPEALAYRKQEAAASIAEALRAATPSGMALLQGTVTQEPGAPDRNNNQVIIKVHAFASSVDPARIRDAIRARSRTAAFRLITRMQGVTGVHIDSSFPWLPPLASRIRVVLRRAG